MFTGLIQHVGRLSAIDPADGGARLIIDTAGWNAALELGESVAVNGACFTVSEVGRDFFACDVLRETLSRTALAGKRQGSSLNLERALALGERFGGHFVTGHVDGTGTVVRRVRAGRDVILRISCCDALLDDMVLKGSIACDGVSLTIANISAEAGIAFFETHLIPFTRTGSALDELREGDSVNIETDMLGKYVRRHLAARGANGKTRITEERLRNAGFGV